MASQRIRAIVFNTGKQPTKLLLQDVDNLKNRWLTLEELTRKIALETLSELDRSKILTLLNETTPTDNALQPHRQED